MMPRKNNEFKAPGRALTPDSPGKKKRRMSPAGSGSCSTGQQNQMELLPPQPMTGYGETIIASNPFDDPPATPPPRNMGGPHPGNMSGPYPGPGSPHANNMNRMHDPGMNYMQGPHPGYNPNMMRGPPPGPNMGYRMGGPSVPNMGPRMGGPPQQGMSQCTEMTSNPMDHCMSPGPMSHNMMVDHGSPLDGPGPGYMSSGSMPGSPLDMPGSPHPTGPGGPGLRRHSGGMNNSMNPMDMPQQQWSEQQKQPPMQRGKVYPYDQPMVFSSQNPNAPPIHPCGVCHKEVQENDQAIPCESGCNFWFHRMCTGLTDAAYQFLTKEIYAEWVCEKCLSTKPVPLVKFKP